MKGLKSTTNFKSFANYVAPEDSIVTKRLYDEGAVILGKTNIPVLLGDHQSFGPLYSTANNPWDINKTPGGSTGGGGAADRSESPHTSMESSVSNHLRTCIQNSDTYLPCQIPRQDGWLWPVMAPWLGPWMI